MKNKIILLLFILAIYTTNIKSQTTSSTLKIENYKYGELDLKVILIGLGKEISIGKLLADGTIQFNWPEITLDSIENASILLSSIKSTLVGMSYCEKDQIEEVSEDCKVINTEFIYLFKNNRQVGVLFPATERAFMDNEPANIYSNLILGSSISWFYSTGDCNFKGNCIEREEWMGKYDFDSQIIYDVHLKKGWNIVQYTLAEIEEFIDENGTGKRGKKVTKKSIDQIPDDIKWHIKTYMKLD